MLNTILHNAQLIIVFAFVLLSLLGGIFRKVQEQREIQRRKAAAERARLEMLRTGRGTPMANPMGGTGQVFQPGPASMGAPVGPPTSAAEALARLEEIARRRQEQMGKVRGAGQPQQRRSNEPTGPVIVMSPSGPIVLRPGQQAGGGGGAMGVPTQGRKNKQGRQQQQQQQQQRQNKPAKQPARPTPPPPPEVTPWNEPAARAAAAASAPAPGVTRSKMVMPMERPRTPEEWRRLAAATAIFGRPVGEQGSVGSGESPGRLF